MTTSVRKWLMRGSMVTALGVVVLLGWLHRDSVPVQQGQMAPAFRAPSLQGDTLALESLRGHIVLLNAWATWCAPCRGEMPALQRVYQRFSAQGLVVVAVSQDRGPAADHPDDLTRNEVAKFVSENRLSFPVLLDPAGRLQRLYGITGLPTTFLIDRRGRIVRRVLGPARWDQPPYSNQIQRLLRG